MRRFESLDAEEKVSNRPRRRARRPLFRRVFRGFDLAGGRRLL